MCNVVYCVICTSADDDDLLQLCLTVSAVRSHSLYMECVLFQVVCRSVQSGRAQDPPVRNLRSTEQTDRWLFAPTYVLPSLPPHTPPPRISLVLVYKAHGGALLYDNTGIHKDSSPAVSDRLTFHLALSRSAATCRCTCTCTLYMYMYCMYIVLVVAVHMYMYMYMYVPFRLKYSLL